MLSHDFPPLGNPLDVILFGSSSCGNWVGGWFS